MVKLTIDGREVEVEPGTTVIQAVRELGADVPHYCWHPGLSVAGNCRICLVEVEGMPTVQISCNLGVRDGMVVHTQSEKARDARQRRRCRPAHHEAYRPSHDRLRGDAAPGMHDRHHQRDVVAAVRDDVLPALQQPVRRRHGPLTGRSGH